MAANIPLRLTVALPLLIAAGCGRHGTPPPPRVDVPVPLPSSSSTIAVPISASLADLARGIDQATPAALWSIDRVEKVCVPAQRVAVFGKKLKVTPDLGCRITGQVTRGPVALAGEGSLLRLTLPVHAEITASRVGGSAAHETATGDAVVHADIRLSARPDWTPAATVKIRYDWTTPPGVTLLGKRITFTDKADAKLAQAIAKLERDLPNELAKLDARAKVAAAWRQGFTSIELNHDDPPVWLRISPRRVVFGGYNVANGRLELTAAAEALTETFVGQRPPDPVPTPLPPLARATQRPALSFQVPVLADYAQLEPVLARALAKLAAKGIDVPGAGRVDARFGKVTIYATEGGRLAVGVDVQAKSARRLLGSTRGRVWLTGVPWNADNSEKVEIRDLRVTGSTDNGSYNLLLSIMQAPAVLETLSGGLTQDFAKDYARVLGSARAAIAERRQGDFVLSANIDRIAHGRVLATGRGLFLPVAAQGQATIRYAPR